MKNEEAIKEYQCSGCIGGPFEECYKTESGFGITCRGHLAGTIIGGGVGKIFLGLPKGFHRLGHYDKMQPLILEDYTEEVRIDKWNIPVWKHLDKHGNTLIRGLRPRINEPFVAVILGNHMDKIDCREISLEEIKAMD